MPRYYFDIRDENDLAVDEMGLELSNIQDVQDEAARSLSGMARDEVRKLGSDSHRSRRMAIEVRDDKGPVLEVKFTVEIEKKKR